MYYTPEPYQKLITDHLLSRSRAAVFAAMGLGKTAATLSALHESFIEGMSSAALIVAPLRVANLTWPNELAKWDQFRGLRMESIRGHRPSGRAHIYTINYERLDELPDLDFCDTIVFDELTRAKGHKSARINALRDKLKKHRRWGLTGTPRPNSLLEIFAQIRLLDDGKALSPSFDAFQRCYFDPVDYNEYKWVPKAGSKEKIYQKIHHLAITLKSSEYLNIPDTTVEDIEVALPRDAHGIYKRLERDLLAVLEGGEEVIAENAAVLVNKLLQITGGCIYTGEAEARTTTYLHAAKVGALLRLLTELKEPVIIACNYVHERERLVKAIEGAVDASKYKGDIELDWNVGKISRLVVHPASMGHGLNMQDGGRTIVWFSQPWSRELYDQMNARLARKGQDQETVVYRIVCPGTMDDCVLETLRSRGEEQSDMLTTLTNFRKQGLTFDP